MSGLYANLVTSGSPCTAEEHKVALENLKELREGRSTVIMTKDTPVEDILQALKVVEVVKIKLDDETTLQVLRNNKYEINGNLFGFNASSTEEGKSDKSVNFTGKQLTTRILKALLSM